MARPSWLVRAVGNWHRHAIEQASRRWREARRDDSARTRREILISTQVEGEGTNTVPRDDVAETMVQSLRHEAFRNRSFDLRSKLEGDGEATSDFSRLLAPLGGRDCDYSLGRIPDG